MKKIVAFILVCLMALSTVVMAADFKDMPNDWSTAALTAAAKNGLLSGNDGYIKPEDNMTRAEMATIMVRACGAIKEADISGFTDVKPEDWFYVSMAKAVAMGAFNGSDNKLNPNSPITRQEAFVVLSRVFGINTEKVNESVLDSFKDSAKIADWAKEGVATIIASGYVSGSDGYVNPLDNISRKEFAVVMDRLIKYYIDDAAQEIPADGNVMIRVPLTEINGLVTDKLVILGDGIGDADIKINDTNISGKLVVRGGKNYIAKGSFNKINILTKGIRFEADPKTVNYVYVCPDSTFALPMLIVSENAKK